MTKPHWKKDKNTARPQRTTPAKKPDKEGAALKAEGKRNKGPKRKSALVQSLKKVRRKAKAEKSEKILAVSRNKYGKPLSRNEAERVLR